MKYSFDEVVERHGTGSIKYDPAARNKPEGVLPMWVADMDFKTAPCVLQAIEEKCRHGIFGYSEAGPGYFKVLQQWFDRRFQWKVQPEWLVKTPGIVTAIHIAIRGLTRRGDAVLIQPPVYYPFSSAVTLTGRKLVMNQLVYKNGRYEIDFKDFEERIVREKVKLFILCNPHNPVGRVWSKEELVRMGELCLRHGVLVISDEIHQDFVFSGHRHQVFAALNPEFQKISITCTSPSKSFNLAGLQLSNIWIPDENLRREFAAEYDRFGLSQLGIFGLVACEAAYREGEEWLTQLLVYIEGNVNYVDDFLRREIPAVRLVQPEGTYLAWLDCTASGLSSEQLERLILNKAQLWLDEGPMFGPGGEGFQRINLACPRQLVQQAMRKLAEVLG